MKKISLSYSLIHPLSILCVAFISMSATLCSSLAATLPVSQQKSSLPFSPIETKPVYNTTSALPFSPAAHPPVTLSQKIAANTAELGSDTPGSTPSNTPNTPSIPSTSSSASTASDQEKEAAKKSDIVREYYLKAAFLRYVVEFVQWPKDTIPDTAVTICVYGDIPALEGLNSINGKIVHDRSIVIRTIPNIKIAQSSKECQMLYLGESKKPSLESIVQEMKNLPVLTFGDKAGLAEKGGTMNFYVSNNRMGIMINQETVAKNKLEINPRMLKLVTVFPDTKSLR